MRTHKQIIIIPVILFLFIPLSIHADENENNQFAQYKNGVQFYIVNGVSVAYKKLISEKNTLRFHLDLSGTFSDNNIENDYYHESEIDTTNHERDNYLKKNNQNIELSFEILNILFQKKFIHFYYGGGPYIGYLRSKSINHYDYEEYINESGYLDSDYTTTNFSLGILGIIGIECPVANRVSIFAEHQLLVYHTWRKCNDMYTRVYDENDYYINNQNSNTRSWNLNLNNITIGVSVYF